MTASWERLAEATDGRYTGADFERAAYQLLVEQVVYAADRGSATPYHLLVTYAAAFKDVLDRLGVTMQHNHHHRPVLARIVAGQAKHLQLMPQVQGAGRFVQQQDARLADHGLGQARDLALAARQPVQTL